MVLMTLDHTRDFFHAGAMAFSPEDLTRTTPILFLTRWITHVCAPAFLFTAGLGAFLRLQRPLSTKAQLSRFLWTRGLWLVLVELTVMRVAMNFSLDARYPVLLLVLWALGVSMIALAALVHLPPRVLAVLSIAVIAVHNGLDGVQASQFGALAGLWNVLHQPGVFFVAGVPVVVGYPLVPWIAVMAAGFCAGPVFLRAPQERRRFLLRWGTVLVVGFVVLRAINLYGDPQPWSTQPSAVFTVISFLRTTKYPPSLAFLLMTLGPALLALSYFDRRGLGGAIRWSSSAACRSSITCCTSLRCTCWRQRWPGCGTAVRPSRSSSIPCRRWAGRRRCFRKASGIRCGSPTWCGSPSSCCFIPCAGGSPDSRRGAGTGG